MGARIPVREKEIEIDREISPIEKLAFHLVHVKILAPTIVESNNGNSLRHNQ